MMLPLAAPVFEALPPDLRGFMGEAELHPTPSLVFRKGAIMRNLDAALRMARTPARLRPHVKTHKCEALVRIQLARGVTRFKCATVAEAAMLARAGARDVLVAYPLPRPALRSLDGLRARHPEVRFSILLDSEASLRALEREAPGLEAWIDCDTGMGRTGIAPGPEALELARAVEGSRDARLAGLHVYDGHRSEGNLAERIANVERELEPVQGLRHALGRIDLPIVGGGTPSFPCYSALPGDEIQCSPGIFLLHDARYAVNFPDLPFEPAAFVLSRIVSRPRHDQMTLDVGTKALCPDQPPGMRAVPWSLPNAKEGAISEEHWIWTASSPLPIGSPVLIVPAHICPTVALHDHAVVIDDDGHVIDTWLVDRKR